MATMRAALCTRPETIEITEVDRPQPEVGEVEEDQPDVDQGQVDHEHVPQQAGTEAWAQAIVKTRPMYAASALSSLATSAISS